MSFNSTDNKKLIWSLLVETAYFKGFPANQKDMVKRVLDGVVHEMNMNPSLKSASTTDKNKEVVKQMMQYRDLWAQDGLINLNQNTQQNHNYLQQPQTQSQQQYQTLPSYVTQVTAEEIREKREQEFNNTLRQKQEEMSGFLNAGKPQEIDFSDKGIDEARIGGDMERLVAEAEAARKRELDTLLSQTHQTTQKDVEQWINGGRPLKIDNESTLPIDAQNIYPHQQQRQTQTQSHTQPHARPAPKAVRFSDEPHAPIKQVHLNNNNHIIKNNNDTDIFTRLKRKPTSSDERENSNSNASTISNANSHRITILEEKINSLQIDVKKILELLTTNNVKSETSQTTDIAYNSDPQTN